jgi:hypothetical protein
MPRIRMLAAGLALMAGWFAAGASAQACDDRLAWLCKSFQGFKPDTNAGAQTATAGPPQTPAAIPATGRRHFASRSRRHRVARHHLLHRSPHLAALGREHVSVGHSALLDTETEQKGSPAPPSARRVTRTRPLDAPGLGSPSWVGARDSEVNVRSDALEPTHRTSFDLVAEWKRAVGELTIVNAWPEETLRSFNDFPP